MPFKLNDSITLIESDVNHAKNLFSAVDANRNHLADFLPWVSNMKTVGDFKNYLQHSNKLRQEGIEYSYNIFDNNNKILGRIGLSRIDKANCIANIGYWLVETAQGKGIITNSVKTLTPFAFETLQLNRLEIKAIVRNHRSRAIPEKLAFSFEGILREAELVNNQFHDLALYSLLKSNWLLLNRLQ